jgi:DHA1 family multidrug resistance protein-like MFS transporter
MLHFHSHRAVSRTVIIAAICVFSTQFGVTVITPLLGWWKESVGASYLATTMIFSAFTIVSTPLSIHGGIISDKLGRKPLVMAGLLLYAVASFLFPFSGSTYDWIVVRALQGAGAGFFFPAVTALLSEVTSYEERGHALSVYNVGLGAGLAAGPISGGFLFDNYGIAMPFFFCAAFALLSVVFVLLFVQEPKERLKREEGELSLNSKEKKALALSCVMIFFGIGVAGIMGALFAPFTAETFALSDRQLTTGIVVRAAAIIGAILSMMFVVFAVLQAGFNSLMKYVGELVLSILGLFFCACGLLVLFFATRVLELFIMSFFLGAGLGAISLGTLTLASNAVGERRGKVMGIYYTIFYAGLGGIPLLFGVLSDIFRARWLFLVYALLLLIVMLVVWRVGSE